MPDLQLHRATAVDREVLERLWLMFAHDLSEHRHLLPLVDGRFRDERLHAALEQADRCAYLLRLDERPVGFALVRSLDRSPRVLASFFVARGARRTGLGRAAVRAVVARHPGAWEVAYQSANAAAAAFWPTIAAELDPDGWHQELRAVPDRPDLAPDAWIAFRSPGDARADPAEPTADGAAEPVRPRRQDVAAPGRP